MSEHKGRPDGPHWSCSREAATIEEYREWLKVPLPGGQQKSLCIFLDCDVCRHLRYEKTIYFYRANWWFWIRRGLFAWRVAWWWFLHPRCEQCKFNKKIGRDI